MPAGHDSRCFRLWPAQDLFNPNVAESFADYKKM